MGSLVVLVPSPRLNDRLGVRQGVEMGDVQALVPQAAVECSMYLLSVKPSILPSACLGDELGARPGRRL